MTAASSPTDFVEVEPVFCVPMSDDSYLTSWRVRLFDFWAMARLIVVDGQDLLTVLCVYLPPSITSRGPHASCIVAVILCEYLP